MSKEDIRWEQRFSNYKKALGKLDQAVQLELDDLYLPYKIDLSILHQISNPDLLGHINMLGKIFYQKEAVE